MLKIKKRLNIFIDESGDFGFVDGSSDLYAVSFTLHESSDSIKTELKYLNEKLDMLNYDGMIHLAYLIAKRGEYSHFNFEKRKSIFWAIFYFSSRVKVKTKTYYDNGQETLATILDVLFATNPNVERRIKFDHTKKRLFQVSDMLTVIDKLDYKRKNNIPFTKAEKFFFRGNDFRHIINLLKNKRI